MGFVNVFIFILRTILGMRWNAERNHVPAVLETYLTNYAWADWHLETKGCLWKSGIEVWNILRYSVALTANKPLSLMCYIVSINLCWPWCFLLHSFMFSSDMSHCAVCFYDSCVCECVCESEREFMTSRMMVWQEVWSSQKAAAFRPCCCRQSTSLPFFFRRLRRVVLTPPPPPPPPAFFSSLPFFSWFLPFSCFCFPSLSFPLLFFFKDNLSKINSDSN